MYLIVFNHVLTLNINFISIYYSLYNILATARGVREEIRERISEESPM